MIDDILDFIDAAADADNFIGDADIFDIEDIPDIEDPILEDPTDPPNLSDTDTSGSFVEEDDDESHQNVSFKGRKHGECHWCGCTFYTPKPGTTECICGHSKHSHIDL